MSKFIGLKRTASGWSGDGTPCVMETSVIVNLDSIEYLEVETESIRLKDGKEINLNTNSTKFLLEILMENEYKLQGVEE